MRPIRLAVIFDLQVHAGGGYQQALNAALITRELPTELVQVLFFTTLDENVATLGSYGIQAKIIQLSFFDKARALVRKEITNPRLITVIKRLEKYTPFEKHLLDHGVDLVYFVSPSRRARNLEQLNYVTTVWDLCHRDDPEFPEVRWNRALESRDRNYQAILPRATAIFVDSHLGKINTLHRYGVDEDRIHVIPFQAAVAARNYAESDIAVRLSVRDKYKLDVPYVFYPAQFWAHKNHVYILEGLKTLEQCHGLTVGAIFSGGDKGNLAYVQNYVRELGLEDRVRFAGFVASEVIPELYRQSIALVMPSYFGPTNLPPLEAFELGVPVLYSDKTGLREQVGDAALLLDLKNPGSMADHLRNLISDSLLRGQLIQAGYARLKTLESVDRVEIFCSILEDFRWRRMCWE